MALRMKHWTLTACTGTALLAIWELPPRAMPVVESSGRFSEDVIVERMSLSVFGSNEALKRLRWSDSLSALAAPYGPGEVFVATPPAGVPTPEILEPFLERVEFELATAPARDPDMRIGFVMQLKSHGSHPAVRDSRASSETYLGTRAGAPYWPRRATREPAGADAESAA
ncbi:MAG: hypothetical protein O2992_14410 [Gemmatimonadetes bacterium]|nr:hypothetical protein [Gemmatimonadota bacterium]